VDDSIIRYRQRRVDLYYRLITGVFSFIHKMKRWLRIHCRIINS